MSSTNFMAICVAGNVTLLSYMAFGYGLQLGKLLYSLVITPNRTWRKYNLGELQNMTCRSTFGDLLAALTPCFCLQLWMIIQRVQHHMDLAFVLRILDKPGSVIYV